MAVDITILHGYYFFLLTCDVFFIGSCQINAVLSVSCVFTLVKLYGHSRLDIQNTFMPSSDYAH